MFGSVHNYYEHMVIEQILLLNKAGQDMSQDLIEDIACIALNHLPPRYIRHNVDIAFNINDIERVTMHNQVIKVVNDALEFAKRRHEQH